MYAREVIAALRAPVSLAARNDADPDQVSRIARITDAFAAVAAAVASLNENPAVLAEVARELGGMPTVMAVVERAQRLCLAEGDRADAGRLAALLGAALGVAEQPKRSPADVAAAKVVLERATDLLGREGVRAIAESEVRTVATIPLRIVRLLEDPASS